MNCCNDYGECKQGHGCPARTMAYNRHFDRLGNPVYRRASSARLHRIVQVLGALACVVLLVMLYQPR